MKILNVFRLMGFLAVLLAMAVSAPLPNGGSQVRDKKNDSQPNCETFKANGWPLPKNCGDQSTWN
ncbi:hypothetical protein Btru_071892 [Bulinus truncatus]|nr:hypothetical protein Btru_071892 [Bulinus truncatus]